MEHLSAPLVNSVPPSRAKRTPALDRLPIVHLERQDPVALVSAPGPARRMSARPWCIRRSRTPGSVELHLAPRPPNARLVHRRFTIDARAAWFWRGVKRRPPISIEELSVYYGLVRQRGRR